MNNAKIYRRLSKSLAQLVSLSKMYNLEHPIVVGKIQSVYMEMKNYFNEIKQSLVFAKSADILLINGEKVETEDKLMSRFVEDFIALDIGSVELEPRITQQELEIFIQLMSHVGHISGSEMVKEFIADKNASHLVARAATFKLVQENEDVVKKGESVNIEELPAEVVERFSSDLVEGKVPTALKNADKDYSKAAHNSTLLAGITYNLFKERGSPADLEKVLWLLADYLVDEIGTFKAENINQKVLEDVKKKLLILWQEKPDKKEMCQQLEKTYEVINSALQIKGEIVLYKKHKKELESSVKKIKDIMKSLPSNSQLYQKTYKSLIEIGTMYIDKDTFAQ